jgi:hypothetical protein
MNRITSEQREAIVRKAVAERDALLHIAGATGPLGDPDVLAAPTEREKFEEWYLRDHFNVKTAAASLAWSAWQASKAETVPIEEYRQLVARCCELGEKIANPHQGIAQ